MVGEFCQRIINQKCKGDAPKAERLLGYIKLVTDRNIFEVQNMRKIPIEILFDELFPVVLHWKDSWFLSSVYLHYEMPTFNKSFLVLFVPLVYSCSFGPRCSLSFFYYLLSDKLVDFFTLLQVFVRFFRLNKLPPNLTENKRPIFFQNAACPLCFLSKHRLFL